MDFDISALDREIQAKEKQQEKTLKQLKRLKELREMPFYLAIQEKDNKEIFKRVHDTQKSTFERICKQEGIHKDDWKDEFTLFWVGFLKGEYKSINVYLERTKKID